MAKVIKDFKDKQNKKKLYQVGDNYTGKREQELIDKGYLEPGLSDLTMSQLKDKADAKGIEYDKRIKKDDLIKLLEK